MILTNLLTNMVLLTAQGAIPTNTAAFQEHVLQSLLTNAQTLASKWRLDESAVRSNKITSFQAIPYPSGPTAMIVFDKRYVFGGASGEPVGFTDQEYYLGTLFSHTTNGSRDVERYQATVGAWTRTPTTLTLLKAQEVARSAMRSFGVPLDTMGFQRPHRKEQIKWKDDYGFYNSNGMVFTYRKRRPVSYRLPYYKFEWEGPKGYCKVDVSGLTTNVVYFDFGWWDGTPPASNVQFMVKPPQNYLQSLGLPSTTVFVRRRYTVPPTYEVVP